MRRVWWFVLAVMLVLLLGCGGEPEPAPTLFSPATQEPVATQASASATRPAEKPTESPAGAATTAPEATALPTPTEAPTPAPTPTTRPTPLPSATPTSAARKGPDDGGTGQQQHLIIAEPTLTPSPNGEGLEVLDLPIGEPGYYVNVAFGFQMEYPDSWHSGFGNRPLLASFSNINPRSRDREAMRSEGCLIEVSVLPMGADFTVDDVAMQTGHSLEGAIGSQLGGNPAILVPDAAEGQYRVEWLYAQHSRRIFTLSLEYAPDRSDICLPSWETVLESWSWFEPQLAQYRNSLFGYSLSYPRTWYRFNSHDAGISLSDTDPGQAVEWLEFVESAVIVEANVFDNERKMGLQQWMDFYGLPGHRAVDMALDGIPGVQVTAEGPVQTLESMSGYYQGALGRVFEVRCTYPVSERWVHRPVAQAILYSFGYTR